MIRDSDMKNVVFNNEFLYFSWKEFPHVLCLRVHLDRDVQGDDLYDAVQEAALRYPYFCRKVIRTGPEALEIAFNEAPVPVIKGRKPIVMGSEEAHGHYLAVNYEKDKVWFHIYHNLTDAKGLTEWVKTVIYLYYSRLPGICPDPGDIRLPGEPFLPGETGDPFDCVDFDSIEKPLSEVVYAKGFLPDTENGEGGGSCSHLISVSTDDAMKLARTIDGSPAALFAYFIKETILELYPGIDEPVVCGIPHSFRDIAAGEANFRNQDVELTIIFDDRLNSLPMDKQLTAIRGRIILQSDPDNVWFVEKNRVKFAASLDEIPTVDERRRRCKDMAELIIRNPETAAVSYVGRTVWGGIRPYILDVSMYASILSAHIYMGVISLGDRFNITFVQKKNTRRYVDTFIRKLRGHGIRAEYITSFDDELCTVELT